MTKHVSDFYNGEPEKEWNRLDHPYTRFEFVTTCDLITNYFPKEGKVCDIGGGPGRYAIELIKQGYDVTLIDLSQELLEIAKARDVSNVICADAKNLAMLESNAYDAV